MILVVGYKTNNGGNFGWEKEKANNNQAFFAYEVLTMKGLLNELKIIETLNKEIDKKK